MRTGKRRYAALDQEIQVHAISELMNFQRGQSENTDETIARFEIILHKAENLGQVQLMSQCDRGCC